MKRLSGLIGFATAVMLAAGPASAIPVKFTDGSFAIAGFTSTKTNVTTTKIFKISPPDLFAGSPTGSFTLVPLPFPLSATPTLNFTNVATFDFANALLGTFTASSATLLASGTGGNAFATWEVDGTFLLGSDWKQAGNFIPAVETWSLTQTGGPKKAISLSGTFSASARSEQSVPEPATIVLFGAGLAGLGARRRKAATKSRPKPD